ncbi:MAG: GPW/gp25 family protein [Bacteroidales bacterium]|nr:GPW/gp25 family protein [Bacteroidales bacterium]
MNYLKLPLNFNQLIHNGNKNNCSLEESIAQYIMMQITCRYGEVAGRRDFGSEIWELEFNQLVRIYEWEEKVKNSLQTSISKYENRLTEVEVDVNLVEIEPDTNSKNYSEIRRQAIITVTGKIVNTGIPFHFNTTVYVSPLSQ